MRLLKKGMTKNQGETKHEAAPHLRSLRSSVSSSNRTCRPDELCKRFAIKPSTFYRWYDRFRSGGPEALEDKPPKPDRVWNRIPDDIRQRVVMMAFGQPELTPRELATTSPFIFWREEMTAFFRSNFNDVSRVTGLERRCIKFPVVISSR